MSLDAGQLIGLKFYIIIYLHAIISDAFRFVASNNFIK